MGDQAAETGYKPGDKALILFPDGEWRPAELSPGFIWATAGGSHHLAAEGGFDARPLLASAEKAVLTDADTEWLREKCTACLGGGCRKCEAVRDGVDRIVRERMAQAWDEGYGACVVAHRLMGRVGRANPYRSILPASTEVRHAE